MPRQRNLLPLGGFLVCLLAFLSYFLVFARFPVTRDVPWASWILFAIGLGLLGVGLVRAFRRPDSPHSSVANQPGRRSALVGPEA